VVLSHQQKTESTLADLLYQLRDAFKAALSLSPEGILAYQKRSTAFIDKVFSENNISASKKIATFIKSICTSDNSV